ncbi:MAG: hypothetical protein J7L96_00580 [Bacteroidales bacterium]|nr:hypothetical protein [Bacteroidales bacterium]
MKPKLTKRVSYRTCVHDEYIPCLIIQGKFLKDLGFNVGDDVKIKYGHKEIAISNK